MQVEQSLGKLSEGDHVELAVTLNKRSGARKARSITLLSRAGDRRELGQVQSSAPTNTSVPKLPALMI